MRIGTEMKKLILIALGVLVLGLGCAQAVDVQSFVESAPYGFLHGLWHGLIAPFSFFISLFKSEVAMYAVNNNGGWYDFGFVIGAGILFGGGNKGRKRRRKND